MMKKNTYLTVILAMIVTFSLLVPVIPVGAQIGSQIDQILPSDQTGFVGTTVSLVGSIDTRNGRFEVYFGNILVANATAQDSAVSAGFRVPEVPAGLYTIILRDVAINNNATKDFTLKTNYVIQSVLPASPAQLQERSIVPLNITVTGGQANTAYQANITVTLPAPVSTNYSRLVTLPTSNQKGTSNTQINFPDAAFEPSGALTDYAGIYKVYFNLSQSLASNQFSVGITESTQYHRGQTVKIRAVGYQANDTVTVTVKNQASDTALRNVSVRPSNEGIVLEEWVVPANAAIGNFDIALSPSGTAKLVPDTQVILVSGYPVVVRVLDLSDRTVPQITIEALDVTTNQTYSGTTGTEGNVTLNLESGQHGLSAFWNGLKVGDASITVTGEGTFDLQGQLGDLVISVQDRNGLLIPNVNLDISYEYSTTNGNQQRTGNVIGQTDASGVYSLTSTPPSITYTIKASVYGITFNGGNDTVSNLPVQKTSQITIICPAYTLTFKITDYNGNLIPDARLALLEINAGIFYSAATDDSGSAVVEATLGKYNTKVYSSNIVLNETVVEAFSDKQVDIQCVLYNLQVNVEVVDFFGQLIPNVNVRLTLPDGTVQAGKTQGDGKAIFARVLGGDMQVAAYLSDGDDYYEARNLHIESPTTVQVRMGRYIVLGGLFVQTSVFITLMIVVPVVVLFLFLEVYRRRKAKPSKPANVENSSSK
jgi:hypothetical protein